MKTVVLGAGISGLALAFDLQRAGEEVAVLEAADAVGGLVRSERRGGYLLEMGPNAYVDRDLEWRDLVSALGLEGEVIHSDPRASKRFIISAGKLEAVPGSPPALIRSRLLSPMAKVRLLMEPVLARRSDGGDESLESFGRRHLGEGALPLLDAFQTGIFAGRPGELSVSSCFPEWVEAERSHRSFLLGMVRSAKTRTPSRGLASFKGGLGEICLALAARLGDSVQTGMRVERVSQQDGRWRAGGQGWEVAADRCVLACGAKAASRLIAPLDAPLSALLQGIRSAPMAVAHFGFARGQVSHPLDGFGFLCGEREGRAVLGCIFSSSVFPDRAPSGQVLLTALAGGMRKPELLELDDGALTRQVEGELRSLLGIAGPPELTRVVRHREAIPQYEVGHGGRQVELQSRLDGHPGLHFLGTAFGGVGVLDCVRGAGKLSRRLRGAAEGPQGAQAVHGSRLDGTPGLP